MIEKIRRRLGKYYYDRKLCPLQRRSLNFQTYCDLLDRESCKPCFRKPIVLIQYDDISLMEGPSFYDYGAKREGIWKKFTDFIKAYPRIKHTLFFVPNPIFTKTGLSSAVIQGEPFDIARASSDHFLIKALQSLEKQGIIEISQHGYYHIQTKYRDYYAPYEFEFLTEEEALTRIQKGFLGLSKFFSIQGFKPPAWGMGQLSGKYQLLSSLKRMDYDYVCLSSPANGLNYSQQRTSNLYPTLHSGLFNIPQNINMLWELQSIFHVIDRIIQKKGIINIQLHFTETRAELLDGISDENFEKLSKIIEYLSKYDLNYFSTRDVKKNCYFTPFSEYPRGS